MSTQSTLIAFCLLQWRLLFLVDQADIRTIWKLDFPIEGIQSLDLDFSVGFRVLLPIYNPDLKIWIHVSQSNVPLETWPSRRATFVMSLVRPGRGSLRKQPTFHDAITGLPAKWHLEMSAEITYWWRVTTRIWVVLLIGWSKFPMRHDQSEALPRTG